MTVILDDNTSNSSTSLTYKDAGVDIDAGNALVEKIKAVTLRTNRPEVLSGLGGFGALCEIPTRYKHPVMVSATDGVGTKLKLAIDLEIHHTIGIDLVAMCVNDLIVCGAEPLFFLDYYASGALDVEVAIRVIEGIGSGCELAGCALIGGETAEMPGVYQHKDYDLAGFSVGIVEKSEIITGDEVQIGDKLIGLASSGPHSNGFSLIRKIIQHCGASLADNFGDSTLGEVLLTPTEIYVKAIRSVHESVKIKALAHITGGGILENLPRVLPANTRAEINLQSWTQPPIFQWLREKGNIQQQEMYRTFNCGIGMVLCVSADDCKEALNVLNSCTLGAYEIGCVKEIQDGEQVTLLNKGGKVLT